LKVKFYAREDALVREAGVAPMVGAPSRCEFDADSEDGRKCIRFCRDGAFWPADSQTASLCGVPLVAVEFKDGAWTAAPPRKAK
jgi:hypothetical protein